MKLKSVVCTFLLCLASVLYAQVQIHSVATSTNHLVTPFKENIAHRLNATEDEGTINIATPKFENKTLEIADVTPLDVSITLFSTSETKTYDGTPLSNPNWYITGKFLPNAYIRDVVVTGSITDVGTIPNTIESYNLVDNDKYTNYKLTKQEGTLQILPRSITLTSESATLEDHEDKSYQKVTIGGKGLAPGDEIHYTFSTPKEIKAGDTFSNSFTAKITRNSRDVTHNYTIGYSMGRLVASENFGKEPTKNNAAVYPSGFWRDVYSRAGGITLSLNIILYNYTLEPPGVYYTTRCPVTIPLLGDSYVTVGRAKYRLTGKGYRGYGLVNIDSQGIKYASYVIVLDLEFVSGPAEYILSDANEVITKYAPKYATNYQYLLGETEAVGYKSSISILSPELTELWLNNTEGYEHNIKLDWDKVEAAISKRDSNPSR